MGDDVRRDVYGNPVDWRPTGRRIVLDGKLRALMTRGTTRTYMFCRPHEGCVECAVPRDHDGCPVLVRGDAPPEKR